MQRHSNSSSLRFVLACAVNTLGLLAINCRVFGLALQAFGSNFDPWKPRKTYPKSAPGSLALGSKVILVPHCFACPLTTSMRGQGDRVLKELAPHTITFGAPAWWSDEAIQHLANAPHLTPLPVLL